MANSSTIRVLSGAQNMTCETAQKQAFPNFSRFEASTMRETCNLLFLSRGSLHGLEILRSDMNHTVFSEYYEKQEKPEFSFNLPNNDSVDFEHHFLIKKSSFLAKHWFIIFLLFSAFLRTYGSFFVLLYPRNNK